MRPTTPHSGAPIGETPGADAGEFYPTRYATIGDDVKVKIETIGEAARLRIGGADFAFVPVEDVDRLLEDLNMKIELWRAS